MSQRRQIVLPDPIDQQLRELAAAADTPPSTLAAQMAQAGVAQAAKDGKVRPLRSTPALTGTRGSERLRDAFADAAGGTGDQGDLGFQVHGATPCQGARACQRPVRRQMPAAFRPS